MNECIILSYKSIMQKTLCGRFDLNQPLGQVYHDICTLCTNGFNRLVMMMIDDYDYVNAIQLHFLQQQNSSSL